MDNFVLNLLSAVALLAGVVAFFFALHNVRGDRYDRKAHRSTVAPAAATIAAKRGTGRPAATPEPASLTSATPLRAPEVGSA
jgi:uncharacterized protein YbjT (DUF2867 family)